MARANLIDAVFVIFGRKGEHWTDMPNLAWRWQRLQDIYNVAWSLN